VPKPSNSVSQNKRHGVWVPACAGTTLRDDAFAGTTSRDDAFAGTTLRLRRNWHHNGAALSPRSPLSFEASEATTMTTAINPTTSVQMALISGFTPSRTSE
jgi:hypothetical protein